MIGLLKKSLGEGLIPKSEALWNWKHEQNPFGASFVLLAEELLCNGNGSGTAMFTKPFGR
jgi:hypothetical protein